MRCHRSAPLIHPAQAGGRNASPEVRRRCASRTSETATRRAAGVRAPASSASTAALRTTGGTNRRRVRALNSGGQCMMLPVISCPQPASRQPFARKSMLIRSDAGHKHECGRRGHHDRRGPSEEAMPRTDGERSHEPPRLPDHHHDAHMTCNVSLPSALQEYDCGTATKRESAWTSALVEGHRSLDSQRGTGSVPHVPTAASPGIHGGNKQPFVSLYAGSSA